MRNTGGTGAIHSEHVANRSATFSQFSDLSDGIENPARRHAQLSEPVETRPNRVA
jgi:hypothetical protein